MKNKYEVTFWDGNTRRVNDVYIEEDKVVEVVADAVVNNEGYLTFMNMEPSEVGQPKASLVKIVAPGWNVVLNHGPFIAAAPADEDGSMQ